MWFTQVNIAGFLIWTFIGYTNSCSLFWKGYMNLCNHDSPDQVLFRHDSYIASSGALKGNSKVDISWLQMKALFKDEPNMTEIGQLSVEILWFEHTNFRAWDPGNEAIYIYRCYILLNKIIRKLEICLSFFSLKYELNFLIHILMVKFWYFGAITKSWSNNFGRFGNTN